MGGCGSITGTDARRIPPHWCLPRPSTTGPGVSALQASAKSLTSSHAVKPEVFVTVGAICS